MLRAQDDLKAMCMYLSRVLPTRHQLFLSLIFGVVLGVVVVRVDMVIRNIFFSTPATPSQTVVAEPIPLASPVVYSCMPVSLGYQAESVSKQSAVRSPVAFKAVPKKNSPRPLALSPIPKHPDKPNAVRIHISQAPLPVSAKKVNGQWVCAVKNDKPKKSDKYKKGHIDRQCCLDPDEIPNPHCNYSYKS